MNMRLAAALLCIALLGQPTAAKDTRIVVFGDSISARHDSWPWHLNMQNTAIHCHCQSGRSLHAPIPHDLWANPGERNIAVLYLGTNDMGAIAVPVIARFTRNIRLLQAMGFEVVLVNIPHYPREMWSSTAADNQRIRDAIAFAGNSESVRYVDLDPHWWVVDTVDGGIHPSAEGSKALADILRPVIEAGPAGNLQARPQGLLPRPRDAQ